MKKLLTALALLAFAPSALADGLSNNGSYFGFGTGQTITVSGNVSSPAWTTNGLWLSKAAATYTDTTSLAGTIAAEVMGSVGGDTLNATNAITVTNLSEVQISAPVAGTNVTATNLIALRVAGNVSVAGTGVTLSSNSANSFGLIGSTASGTVPVILPRNVNTTTGFGSSAANAIDAVVSGVDVMRWGTGSHIYGIATGTAAANQTGYICYNAGSTPANEYLEDTVTCLASLEEYKNIQPGGISGDQALSEIMQMHPFWYTWNQKRHPSTDWRSQPGLGAHAMEKIDPRLVAYSAKGKLQGVRYEQMTAFLVAAIQQQQHEIDALKRRH